MTFMAMTRTDRLFVAAALAGAAAFVAGTLGAAAAARTKRAAGGASADGEGLRAVDTGKIDEMTRKGLLSDREAMFYRKLGRGRAPQAAAGRAAGAPGESGEGPSRRRFLVMGTECLVTAYAAPGAGTGAAGRGIDAAEEVMRRVDALMSAYAPESEVSRLNAAGPGEFRLSPETLHVLGLARRAHADTRGAFDATCRPLIELWKAAAGGKGPPDESAIERALAASGWAHLDLAPGAAVKKDAAARVDLGGIAKGYGVDRAAEAMRAAGCSAGMVEAGGDLRCFGEGPEGGRWAVAVRHPFKPGAECARLSVRDTAVSTSGPYFRFIETGGTRLSHIVDPRTGRPADAAACVVAAAATAAESDVWATALAVLGPEGMDLLPPGVEAMVIVGVAEAPRAMFTAGFRKLIDRGPEFQER